MTLGKLNAQLMSNVIIVMAKVITLAKFGWVVAK